MTVTTDTMPAPLEGRVRDLLDEVISASDVFLVDIVVRGRTGSRVVDVFVDREGALSVTDLAGISRELGARIEEADFIRGGYRLNVSTPGADRPLIDARQYSKHVGRPLRVVYRVPDQDEPAVIEGKLVSVDGLTVVLRSRDEVEHRIGLESVEEATVQLPW